MLVVMLLSQLLEVLDIREGRDLGMKTLSSLLLHSNNLRRVVGALSWGGMCRCRRRKLYIL